MNSSNASSGSKPMNVTVLGSGDAFATAGRSQSGYLVRVGGTCVLMDAGPDLLGSMKRKKLAPADLDVIAISHLHGDHYGGIPFLMLEYLYESRPDRIIHFVGPRNLESRCWRMMKLAYPRFNVGVIRPWLHFIEIEPHQEVRAGKARISAIRSPHMETDISLSLKLRIAGRTIVYSGDSGWNEELVSFAEGADLFICECTYYESSQLTFHMNYPQLAANRSRFKVKRMLLSHLGREVLAHKRNLKMKLAFDGLKIKL
jgi:ribonuclease BN (tRNA processing enzyme)